MRPKLIAALAAAASALAHSRHRLAILAVVLLSCQQPSDAHAVTVTLSPASGDFGNVPVNTTSGPITVTATATLDNAIQSPSGFFFPIPSVPFSLALGDCEFVLTCTFDVFVFPTSPGAFSGSVSLDFAYRPLGPGTEGEVFITATLPLSGTAVAPAAVPVPPAMGLFAGGLGVIGLLARRRKKQAAAARYAINGFSTAGFSPTPA